MKAAILWFRHQPLPGFGKAPEQLVEGEIVLELFDPDGVLG